MQVGKGKQGVTIGEYSPENGKTKASGSDLLGYIEPAGDKPQWILWFDRNGNATLYTKRTYNDKHHGAVEGDPIRVNARKGALTKLLFRDKHKRVLEQTLGEK